MQKFKETALYLGYVEPLMLTVMLGRGHSPCLQVPAVIQALRIAIFGDEVFTVSPWLLVGTGFGLIGTLLGEHGCQWSEVAFWNGSGIAHC